MRNLPNMAHSDTFGPLKRISFVNWYKQKYAKTH